jgi:hypothetical protein
LFGGGIENANFARAKTRSIFRVIDCLLLFEKNRLDARRFEDLGDRYRVSGLYLQTSANRLSQRLDCAMRSMAKIGDRVTRASFTDCLRPFAAQV